MKMELTCGHTQCFEMMPKRNYHTSNKMTIISEPSVVNGGVVTHYYTPTWLLLLRKNKFLSCNIKWVITIQKQINYIRYTIWKNTDFPFKVREELVTQANMIRVGRAWETRWNMWNICDSDRFFYLNCYTWTKKDWKQQVHVSLYNLYKELEAEIS